MTLELDHVFVMTRDGAPEADLLRGAGFTEGPRNSHPGQGTACRRFFFRNAYLEFLWVSDGAEARSEGAGALGLWERSRHEQTGASPFGVGLRAVRGEALPFPTWRYRPAYRPPDDPIEVVGRAPDHEAPLVFVLRCGRRPEDYPPERIPPLAHRCGANSVTGLRLTSPGDLSWLVSALGSVEIVSLRGAGPPDAILELDGAGRGVLELHPELPLTLRW